jgi:transcriptional regulator with XRE-family HTH domain
MDHKFDKESTLPLEVSRISILEDKTLAQAWRKHLGLTQDEVSKRLGISQAAYAQMERRENGLGYATRQRLAEAFGIEPEQLRLSGSP